MTQLSRCAHVRRMRNAREMFEERPRNDMPKPNKPSTAANRFIQCLIAISCMASAIASAAEARTILFVGNSYTYGQNSSVRYYKADTVTDLNGPGATGKTVGGVPAIFKAFTVQAGLDYAVSVETVGGIGLDYHYAEKRHALDQPWDVVALQGLSTLEGKQPGNPEILRVSSKNLVDMFRARNPRGEVWMTAVWSRPDKVYPEDAPWYGTPIDRMGADISVAYNAAAKNANASGVVEIGLAWNRAIATRVAGSNPYLGMPSSQINLWSWDNFHPSDYGYYLEALMLFGKITGKDPLSLGENEAVAEDLGFSKSHALALQKIAHDQLLAK
ncbi:PEP-CTERM sorting domain-containing protein [Herbaspirillum robiniae]|uniref:PEP-CTERM sorting domain-containing protein n=1 Tax=Herbaspirillum robiniae TaxID=2014887 RepID=UPI003D778F08